MSYSLHHVSEIFKSIDSFSNVIVEGWIRTNRSGKNVGFIALNDGTTFKNVQIVYGEDIENFEEISKFKIASAILVEGKVVKTPESKQPFEIAASRIVLLADSDSDYPLQKKRHSFEYLRTIAHIRPRSNTFTALFRLRSLASFAIHLFFRQKNFVYVNTPVITSSDCEGAGEMFCVTALDLENLPKNSDGSVNFKEDFFGKQAFLTVSGQLALEPFAFAFRDVYTFGPTFRAENSNTSRHAAEFWMLEPECCFVDVEGCMNLAEEMIKFITQYLVENAKDELEFFENFIDKEVKFRLDQLLDNSFERISYTKAIEILQEADTKFEYPVFWGVDLQSEHERYLVEVYFKKPTFVYNYPKEIKSFYMRQNDDQKTVAACDLLVPKIGELVGGSQREERYDLLVNRMDELGLDKNSYSWYLDTRKYGGCVHSGFGMGFDRYLMYITGMQNIRDTAPYPRTPKQAEC